MAPFRTRIAPTPSGHLHRGNAFAFLATYLWAQTHQASLLLRFDDLDQPRYRREYAESIFHTLHLLDIQWDKGPRDVQELEQEWSQKYRLEHYQNFLEKLKNRGTLFACSCSRKDLIAHPEGYVYPGTCLQRGLAFRQKAVAWRYSGTNEAVLYPFNESEPPQKVSLPPTLMHMVLRRKDGLPAYQVASLCDDLHYGITHIIRGMDLWPSSIAQLCLAANGAPEFTNTRFWHHQLLNYRDGSKMSKSQQAPPVNEELSNAAGKEKFYGDFCEWMGWPEKYRSTREILQALKKAKLNLL